MWTKEEFETLGYTGKIFKCEFSIEYLEYGKQHRIFLDEEYYFEDEDERDEFVDEIRDSNGEDICDLEEGQCLLVEYGEYPVEDGWVNFDLGIRLSTHVVVDCD